MKTTLGILLGSLLASSVAFADATTGPDFVAATPRRHVDPSLVASDATNTIDPHDVVAFALDEARLTDAGMTQVDTTARWLLQHPGHRVVLEGHTDEIGVEAYNEDLAMRRITTVRDRLIRRGIASDRIVTVNYGERKAIRPNNPNDRRVEMFATTLSKQAVASAALEHGHPVVATWVDRDAIIQLRHTGEAPAVISRR